MPFIDRWGQIPNMTTTVAVAGESKTAPIKMELDPQYVEKSKNICFQYGVDGSAYSNQQSPEYHKTIVIKGCLRATQRHRVKTISAKNFSKHLLTISPVQTNLQCRLKR